MTAWDVYFSGIVGWCLHPGYNAGDPDLEWCADLADRMVEVRERRCPG